MTDGFTTFLVEYQFKGETWSITIPARSWEEADARIRRLGTFGRVVGSDVTTIPASLGWYARLLVAWRNWWMQA